MGSQSVFLLHRELTSLLKKQCPSQSFPTVIFWYTCLTILQSRQQSGDGMSFLPLDQFMKFPLIPPSLYSSTLHAYRFFAYLHTAYYSQKTDILWAQMINTNIYNTIRWLLRLEFLPLVMTFRQWCAKLKIVCVCPPTKSIAPCVPLTHTEWALTKHLMDKLFHFSAYSKSYFATIYLLNLFIYWIATHTFNHYLIKFLTPLVLFPFKWGKC